MKNNCLTLLFLCFCFSLSAQLTYEKKIEFESKDGYSGEVIRDFGENGFMLMSDADKIVDNQQERKYDFYDSDMNLVNSKSIREEKKYRFSNAFNTDRHHFLFLESKTEYILYTIDVATQEISKVRGTLEKKLRLSTMIVVDDVAIFKARRKKEPAIFTINWSTGTSKLTPIKFSGVSNSKISFMGFQILKEAEEVLMFFRLYKDKTSNEINMIRLNNQGIKKDIFTLKESASKHYVSITASSVGEDTYVFTGTYSSKGSVTSEGLFFCEANKTKTKFIKFYNYTKIENFLSYLPKKTQDRIAKKKKKKSKKGKELKLNYLLAIHPVMNSKAGGYLLLAEAFYPTYRTETYTTYSNGKMTTQTRQVFDGYQYTHCTLASFNEKGEILWNKVFPLTPNFKPYYVARFVEITKNEGEELGLKFVSNMQIQSKSFDYDGTLLSDKSSETVKFQTDNENDKSLWTSTRFNYWYDKYFIAYGTQKIKNTEDKGVKRKRTIFFVTKIGYE